MSERIVVIGGGGAAREMLDVIDAINSVGDRHIEVLGVLDDGQPDEEKLAAYGTELLGSVEDLAGLPSDVGYAIGIGAPGVRSAVDTRAGGRSCPVLVHPTAVLGRRVELGPGTLVAAGAVFMNHVVTGRHVHVSVNCSIGHDVRLGDYVEVSPLVALSGFVTASEGAFFGTGAKVNPGLRVGARATLGAGAVAVRDVAPDVTAVGVPARTLGGSRGV